MAATGATNADETHSDDDEEAASQIKCSELLAVNEVEDDGGKDDAATEDD